jgi:hypothetical protein
MDHKEQSIQTQRNFFVLFTNCLFLDLFLYQQSALDDHAKIERGIVLELSMILASSCRQKILRVLSRRREIRIMKLVQETGCTYNEIMRNVRILEDEGVITYRRVGRKCIISLNWESRKTVLLIKALRILNTPIDSGQPLRENNSVSLRQEERPDASSESVTSEVENYVSEQVVTSSFELQSH